ncbi:PEP-CTERM sorting domain-containing protein [bacterium]|nr:PEP-CTERM sorting domain-containing protein [bacterium]
MIKKFLFAATVFSVALVSISQAKADYIVDFTGAGLHPSVSRSIVNGGFSGPDASVTTNPNSLVFTTNHTGASRTGSVRYDFDNGLNDFLGGLNASKPFSLVRFEVAMATSLQFGHGNFAITGRYFESGSSAGTVFSSFVNPDSGGARVIMETDVTMADLQVTDIDAVEWTVAYTGGNTAGLTSSFTFGNSSGLIAAPEPTSAAMIGCALVGLIARRRRKA